MTLLLNNENKLYIDKIDKDTYESLNNILLSNFIIPRKLLSGQAKTFNSNINNDNSLSNIIILASSFFNKAGLNVNSNNYIIEFHHFDYDEMASSDSFDFDNIVCANDILLDTNYHTCIFCTQKDESLYDGNIDIYIDDSNFFSIIGLKEKKINEIYIKTGDVMVCDGDLQTCQQKYNGNGVKNYIVVYLESV
jgi:hypothetical protein